MANEYLFVYGTLKSTFNHPQFEQIKRYTQFISVARYQVSFSMLMVVTQVSCHQLTHPIVFTVKSICLVMQIDSLQYLMNMKNAHLTTLILPNTFALLK